MSLRGSLRVLGYFSSVKAYNPAKNYYKVLNLTQRATQQDIKRSFRQLAKKYHPDSNKGKQQVFKEVNEAYQVLSDESVKRSYDEERRTTQQSPRYSSRTGPQTQSYQSSNKQREQSRSGQPGGNYRGYQREQGWQNRNFREQFMHDLHRAQQGEYSRNFHPSDRERYQQEFRENMRRATQKADETIRQYSEQIKKKQAEMRRSYQQEQRRKQQQQEERQKEYYREYRGSTYQDTNQKMKEKLNKFAEDIAGNIKQALSVADELKNMWNNIKKKK